MSKRTILQLGAGPLMVHSIRKMQEIGLRVLAADANPAAPGLPLADASAALDIRDASAIERFAHSEHADAILAVNDAGVTAASEASWKLGLPNLPPEVALQCVHKGKMRLAWAAAGLPQPEFVICSDAAEAAAAAAKLEFPLVLKPAMNWGSRGVSLVATPADLPWAIEFAAGSARGAELMVERCAPGIEMTVEGLVVEGHPQVLAASDKEPQPHPRYRVAMALNYPPFFPRPLLDRVYDIVGKAALALGIENGAFHCECMVDGERVALLEMGGRPGGGHIFGQIVEAVSGICMPQALARILLGERPDVRPAYQHGACYKFFNAPQGVFRAVYGLEEAKKMPGILDFGFFMKAGTVVGPVSGDADRPGYIVSRGATREEARENAERALRSLHFEMESSAAEPGIAAPPRHSSHGN